MQELFSSLIEIFTTKLQSSHHETSVSVIFQIFTKTPNICQYISLVNHNIKFQQPPGPEIMQELFSSLFDISTTKLQSSHHETSVSAIFQFFTKTPYICQYISFANHNIKFQQPLGQEIMQKLFSFSFDISTTKVQSSHHKISFLQFSKFSQKLQIYVNTLALRTIISSFNNPTGPEILQKLF